MSATESSTEWSTEPADSSGDPAGGAMVDRLVDWGVASATARRLARPGPEVSTQEAAEVVAELRGLAAQARGPVAAVTGLDAPADGAQVLVIDRPGWIDANLAMLRSMLEPVVERLAEHRQPSAVVSSVGSKVTGAEAGGLLALLSGKVLGQYDIAPDTVPRLLLVAPNLVAVERELDVVPGDFRLWVCLHEETHRVQFTAVPWLREHVLGEARDLAIDLLPDPSSVGRRIEDLARALPEVLRGQGGSLAEVLATPEQRERLARLTAVMSLLEGHADVVMDDVGPQVVGSVAQIRERFQARRAGRGGVDRLLRRLLGLEAKMRQYRDGARFVRAAVEAVGMDGFNRVWTAPETLPTPAEIEDPKAWLARVQP
jgi:coenzyme F420 biosynthesis associated uncharacterized protein